MAYKLAGVPLNYKIALDTDTGVANELTLLGYDSTPVHLGLPGGYINVRQEAPGRKPGIDYIDPPDDIEQEYGEPAPVFGTDYFWTNIEIQAAKWKRLGVKIVDADNLDTYTTAQAFDVVNRLYVKFDINVLLKNPNLFKGSKVTILHQPGVEGILVEKDDDASAQSLDNLRIENSLPDLPIYVVAYDDGRQWAEKVAADARRLGLLNFGVTYSEQGEYGSVTHLLRPQMAGNVPALSPTPWVDTLEADIGKYHDGPDVPMLAQQVARVFPSHAAYAAVAGQGTAWCGIFVAYKLSRYGIEPPYNGEPGVESWMYVDAWLKLKGGTRIASGKQRPGDLALWLGSPHHISFVVSGGYIGGNQGDGVTKASFRTPDAFIRPPAPENYVPSPETMPMLMIESSGEAVVTLQKMLNADLGLSWEPDGEFGEATEAAVKQYQLKHGLEVDGIVGPETWASLFDKVPAPPPTTDYLLTPEQINHIFMMAASSAIAKYSWKDRGRAPLGYTKGLAVMFAQCLRKLEANDSAVFAMTQPIGNSGKDALAYYTVSATGRANVLRKLFVMLYGLGMRESSGNYTEGRDMSASNVTADTAEAGLFQQSWNSSSANNEMKKLLPAYSANKQPCYSNIFKEGITQKSTTSYGTGAGKEYQDLAKACPAFATEMCGVGLRVLYNHWGPVVRQEVEMRVEADVLLADVEVYIRTQPIPEPEPPTPEPEPVPVTEIGKARKRALDKIETAVDALIADVVRITEADNPNQAQPQVTGTGISLGNIPPAWIDGGIRLAWPSIQNYIQQLDAEEAIELKDKIMSGQFGLQDLFAIVAGGGGNSLMAIAPGRPYTMLEGQANPTTVHATTTSAPQKKGILMSDAFWMNIRYALIAMGVGILVKYSGGLFSPETAESLIAPLVGGLIAAATTWWGNYVRKDTKTVPAAEARREDVETVSPATGAVEPGNVYR